MRSNFECPMNLKNSNKMLEVCGPVLWETNPPEPRRRVRVTITQPPDSNRVVAAGTSVKDFGPGDDEWMFFLLTVPPAPMPLPGMADATAQFVDAQTGVDIG